MNEGRKNKIKVAIRVRPYLEEEIKNDSEISLNPAFKFKDQTNEIE